MRGIKECVNWLIDNEGKKIVNEIGQEISYGERFVTDEDFKKLQTTDEETEYVGFYWVEGGIDICMSVLHTWDWEPVPEPVDFMTAKYQCQEFGHKFIQYEYDPNNCCEYDLEATKRGSMFKRNGKACIITYGEYQEVEIDGMWYVEE